MSAGATAPLVPLLYRDLLEGALGEDLGRGGDITTDAIVPVGATARGELVARAAGRLCGLEVALETFRLLDPEIAAEVLHGEGSDVEAGTTVARVQGLAAPMLTAERTALNLLGRLSGIATATRDLVARVEGHRARIACTRKTTPGLRALEKYAVRVGGGANHRFGLDDAVLIKDNHLAIAGSVEAALRAARARVGHTVRVEVEVDSPEQLREALASGVDAVLLDNMSVRELRAAVEMASGRALLEASGGITPETVAAVAATGVDLISVGWLTHSAPSLDVALDLHL